MSAAVSLQVLQSTIVLVFATVYTGVLARAEPISASKHGPSIPPPFWNIVEFLRKGETVSDRSSFFSQTAPSVVSSCYHTISVIVGEFQWPLHRTGHDDRVNPKQRTVGELIMAGALRSAREREGIRVGIEAKESLGDITRRLGRASSTITRDVRRNGGRSSYCAVGAQGRSERLRWRRCDTTFRATPELARHVEDHLRARTHQRPSPSNWLAPVASTCSSMSLIAHGCDRPTRTSTDCCDTTWARTPISQSTHKTTSTCSVTESAPSFGKSSSRRQPRTATLLMSLLWPRELTEL